MSIKLHNEEKPIILIVTGPCGSGKTTITDIIASTGKFIRISGDEIKDEHFPEIERITDYPEALEKVYIEMFQKTKENFELGKNVVIDYIILGQKRIDEYKKAFQNNLVIKVLFSSKEVIIERDKTRECWTAGEDCVNDLYDAFYKLQGYIGIDNYIDSSEETPEETYSKYFADLVC
ncbi:AAA family ATPase [Mobilitalea sibirica]|uniref:AAA family ATPase n=1 Tax=Mobilitalea sibirica TaxID=1462919 RepID=A0A8J7HCF1_9FIRM|nr:AAA family ATPase [Mobilitalea sibirica]MBH1940897.1 AAA family ATPase [Mobilitalea sibirica]